MLTPAEARVLDAAPIDECITLLQDLVRIDSSVDDRPVAAKLRDLFKAEGIDCQTQEVPEVGKNVIATLGGGSAGRRLLYNAHMDTVPVGDTTPWTHPPLAAKIAGGRLYGRGSSDCKGGLAAMAMACVALKRAEVPLSGELTLAAVSSETKGNKGTLHLAGEGLTADFPVLGEYSEAKKIAIAYRGVIWGRVTVRGRTTHPGRVANGSDAIRAFIDHVAPALRHVPLDHEPHSLVPPAALTITRIDAGHAVNAVADRCSAMFDIRLVPGQKSAEIWTSVESAIDKASKDAAAAVELELIHRLDPFETLTQNRYVQTLSQSVSELMHGQPGIMGKAGMCDGNVLANDLGIPSVAYGPGNPSSAAVDEYCDLSALHTSLKTYTLFALRTLLGKEES